MWIREMFRPTKILVEPIGESYFNENPQMDLPSLDNFVWSVNKKRSGGRPKHPANLEFDLEMNNIPLDFLLRDIQVGSDQDKDPFLLFCTEKLEIMSACKRWYMDGTFKLVKHPFT